MVLKPLGSLLDPDFHHYEENSLDICYTSSIMIFRSRTLSLRSGSRQPKNQNISELDNDEPHRRTLRCVLHKYSPEDGLLRKCLDLEPPITGGALCVQVGTC